MVLIYGLAAAPVTSSLAADPPSAVYAATIDDVSFAFNLMGEIAPVNSINTGFGTGSYDLNGVRKRTDVAALEFFMKPRVSLTYDLGSYSLYSRLSATVAATTLDGDAVFPINLTDNNPRSAAVEEALIGIRSGALFDTWGWSDAPDLFDLSYGAQDFFIGDGFLIRRGATNGGTRGAYWAGTHNAFQRAAILRINAQPVRADLFQLKSNAKQSDLAFFGYSPQFELYGGNVEYRTSAMAGEKRLDQVYAITIMQIYNADDANTALNPAAALQPSAPLSIGGATRNGMNVFDIRLQGAPFPSLPDLFVSGEAVYERNPHTDPAANGFSRRLEAHAWYAEAAWDFGHGQAPSFLPQVGYRYSHFSGQQPGSSKTTVFDPLTFGPTYTPPRSFFGTWTLGEIVGNDYLTNSNANVHQLYIRAPVTSELSLTMFVYQIDFDQMPTLKVHSKAAFNEVDFEFEYLPAAHPWLIVTGVLGIAQARSGGKQYIDATIADLTGGQGSVSRAGDYQGVAEAVVFLNF